MDTKLAHGLGERRLRHAEWRAIRRAALTAYSGDLPVLCRHSLGAARGHRIATRFAAAEG